MSTQSGAKHSGMVSIRSIDWSIDWLIDCSVGFLIDWLIDWLIGPLQYFFQVESPAENIFPRIFFVLFFFLCFFWFLMTIILDRQRAGGPPGNGAGGFDRQRSVPSGGAGQFGPGPSPPPKPTGDSIRNYRDRDEGRILARVSDLPNQKPNSTPPPPSQVRLVCRNPVRRV